jgi:hypothetical protein
VGAFLTCPTLDSRGLLFARSLANHLDKPHRGRVYAVAKTVGAKPVEDVLESVALSTGDCGSLHAEASIGHLHEV